MTHSNLANRQPSPHKLRMVNVPTVNVPMVGRSRRLLIGTLLLLGMFAPVFGLSEYGLYGAEPPQSLKLFDGKSLKGWRTASKFDYEKHGKVEAADGTIRLGMGKPATGVVCTAKLPREDYELSFDAQRTDGGDFFCGLTFPVGKEFCSLIVGGWGGGVIGLSNVDGMSAIENETTGYEAFKNNQWYKIRLRVTAGNISAWVDKKQVIDLDREGRKFSIWWEQEPMRPLGIANWNTASALRNIQFRDLDKKRAAKQAADAKRKKAASDKRKPSSDPSPDQPPAKSPVKAQRR